MLLSQPHSVYYVLELQLKQDKRKWYVFAQGISPLFYNLEGIQHFRIYKKWFQDAEFQKKDITWRFIAFQQRYKRWRLIRKKIIQAFLRGQLERGEVTIQQLLNR